ACLPGDSGPPAKRLQPTRFGHPRRDFTGYYLDMKEKFPPASVFSMVESVAQEVHDFVDGGITKTLAAILQGLGKTDGHILHPAVRLLGAAHQQHFLGARDAFVLILVVQADTEQPDNLWFGSRTTNHGQFSLCNEAYSFYNYMQAL